MSRQIPGRADHSEEETLRNTDAGRLIFTDLKGRPFAFLVKENRLLRAMLLTEEKSAVGAVYLGKVKKLVRNINACFIEIEGGRLVYLSLDESGFVCPVNRTPDGRILEGDEFPVQIQRDALKTKQEAATAKISLAGRYVVFHVGPSKIFFSGKLTAVQKKYLNGLLKDHGIADSCGRLMATNAAPSYSVILRTEAADASWEAIFEEFCCIQEQFLQLFDTARYRTCFSCLRDAPGSWEAAAAQIAESYAEAVTDDPKIYDEMKEYFHARNIPLRLYTDDAYPLNRLYSLETKMEEALSRRVWLKSGAYLIIDITEAFTVIDVNSGKYDAAKASEEALYHINLEAAREIALQIRLRNLYGIILIDFISMKSAGQQGDLLHEMRRLVKDDKVMTKVIDITPLGIMEMTRKKVNKSLEEQLKFQKK